MILSLSLSLTHTYTDADSGAVYVYQYDSMGDMWTPASQIASPAAGALFGSSSSLVNDVLAIGARGFSEWK